MGCVMAKRLMVVGFVCVVAGASACASSGPVDDTAEPSDGSPVLDTGDVQAVTAGGCGRVAASTLVCDTAGPREVGGPRAGEVLGARMISPAQAPVGTWKLMQLLGGASVTVAEAASPEFQVDSLRGEVYQLCVTSPPAADSECANPPHENDC